MNIGYIGQTPGLTNRSATDMLELDQLETDQVTQVGAAVVSTLLNDQYRTGKILVAFARETGVHQLQAALEQSSDQRISLIVGVDFGNTTVDALTELLETSIDTRVFEGNVTYHPKVYYFTGPERARVIVGSANLTEAGLNTNIETALMAEGTSSDQIMIDARKQFKRLWTESTPLSEELINDLTEEGKITSKDAQRSRQSGLTDDSLTAGDKRGHSLGRQQPLELSSEDKTTTEATTDDEIEARLGLPAREEMPPIKKVNKLETTTHNNYYNQLINDQSNQPSRIRRIVRSRGEIRKGELKQILSGQFDYSLSGSFGASLNILTQITNEIKTEGSGDDQRLIWDGE